MKDEEKIAPHVHCPKCLSGILEVKCNRDFSTKDLVIGLEVVRCRSCGKIFKVVSIGWNGDVIEFVEIKPNKK